MDADRWELVAANLGLIGHTLRRMDLGRQERRDLWDAGLDGLVRAVCRHDGRGKFSTYACVVIWSRVKTEQERRAKERQQQRVALLMWKREWQRRTRYRPARDDSTELASVAYRAMTPRQRRLVEGWVRGEAVSRAHYSFRGGLAAARVALRGGLEV